MDWFFKTAQSLIALGALALAGCAGLPSSAPPAVAADAVHRDSSSSCPVAVWASTVNQGYVVGYGAGGNYCTTIFGSGSHHLMYANGLATSAHRLYVADKQGKIFVFTTSGTFVKEWSTTIG